MIDSAALSTGYSTRAIRGRPRLGVEGEPCGPRVAVARLADAAGVEQPAALCDVEGRARGDLGALGRIHVAVVVGAEAERDVGVADHRDARRLARDALARLLGPQDVLPDRVPRRGVIDGDLARLVGRLEALEEGAGVIVSSPRVQIAASAAAGENDEMSSASSAARSWFPARQSSERSAAMAEHSLGCAP